MRVIFAGVGEAFDENLGNTTVLVTTGSGKRKRQILLDCGFTGAHAFWKASQDPMDLDAIWVSHFHGDHFFGVPLVLLRGSRRKSSQPWTLPIRASAPKYSFPLNLRKRRRARISTCWISNGLLPKTAIPALVWPFV